MAITELFQQEGHAKMKGKSIYFKRQWGDKPVLGKTDLARLDRMTEEELTANALSDPDNPPLTKAELAKFKRVNPPKSVDVKSVRKKMNVSQEDFAYYFGVNVSTLRDWEQHRHEPGPTARNFLLVVDKEPRMVLSILNKAYNIRPTHKAKSKSKNSD